MPPPPFDPPTLLRELRSLLKGQRYLIMWVTGEDVEFVASHGIEGDLNHSAPISHSVFHKVLDTGEPVLSEDMSLDGDFDSNTFLLSDIRSVICVPVLGPERRVLGVLYSDHLTVKKAFTFTDLLKLRKLASRWEQRPALPVPIRQAAPVPTPAPRSEPSVERTHLSRQERMTLLRSLSSFLQAGIPLLRALHCLETGGDSERFRRACGAIGTALQTGNSLSASLSLATNVGGETVRLVQLGERTGGLDAILRRLVVLEEKSWANHLKLVSNLVYPLFLLGACLLAAAILPSWALSGQLEALRQQGAALPWISSAVLMLGRSLGHPLTWLLGTALTGLALWALRMAGESAKAQGYVLRLPYVGKVLLRYAELRFCLSLSLALQAGMGILEAVPSSVSACGWAHLQHASGPVVNELRDGAGVAKALSGLPMLSGQTLTLVAVAEESGRLAETLGWVSRVLETDLELSLEAATAALEPAIMVVMGIVVAVITLAAMLPSVQLIESI